MTIDEYRLCLARAIWRVENQDTAPDTASAISEAFLAEKEAMLVKAIQVMRHLENQGVFLRKE